MEGKWRKLNYSFAAAVSLIIITGCSGGKILGRVSLSHPSSDTPSGDNAPPASTPPTLDINASDVSPLGCLDLELLTKRLTKLSEGAIVRQYTRSLKMENTSIDGKPLLRARNMLAETALANFRFAETPLPTFVGQLPQVQQEGCTSVDITDAVAGKIHYKILADSVPSILHLEIPAPAPLLPSLDNPNPKVIDIEREKWIALKNPRALEVTSIAPYVDRCPSFLKVKMTVVRESEWGMAEELATRSPEVSTVFLKNIAVAVREMPLRIIKLMSAKDAPMVKPEVEDLLNLRHARLDPQIARCPFNSTPPSADEPPPPEEETPSPTPTATPPPGPTPAPLF